MNMRSIFLPLAFIAPSRRMTPPIFRLFVMVSPNFSSVFAAALLDIAETATFILSSHVISHDGALCPVTLSTLAGSIIHVTDAVRSFSLYEDTSTRSVFAVISPFLSTTASSSRMDPPIPVSRVNVSITDLSTFTVSLPVRPVLAIVPLSAW